MKRKLVLHGPSTLTVSLPAEWVKKFNLTKGDEVSVTESGNELVVKLDEKRTNGKKNFHLKDFVRLGKTQVTSSYRSGYNELAIEVSHPSSLSNIQELVAGQLLGYEIVEHTKNSALIKYLGNDSREEFEKSFERVWSLVKNFSNEIVTAIIEGNLNQISDLMNLDVNINRFSNYCLRILSVNGHINYKKSNLYYYIVRNLEELADSYKEICKLIIKTKVFPSARSLEDLRKLNSNIGSIYNLFQKFDNYDAEELYKKTNFNILDKDSLSIIDVKIGNIYYKLKEMISVVVEIHI